MYEPISTIKHMPLGPNIHTYMSILACFCHTYISETMLNTIVLEKIIKKTSKTNCYVSMYVCMLVDFRWYLSCENGLTYIHTWPCNNFLTPQFSMYVSKTTIKTMQNRFWPAFWSTWIIDTYIHTYLLNNWSIRLFDNLKSNCEKYVWADFNDKTHAFGTKHTYIHVNFGVFLPYIHFRNHVKYHRFGENHQKNIKN